MPPQLPYTFSGLLCKIFKYNRKTPCINDIHEPCHSVWLLVLIAESPNVSYQFRMHYSIYKQVVVEYKLQINIQI